jgi:hypothetical protein
VSAQEEDNDDVQDPAIDTAVRPPSPTQWSGVDALIASLERTIGETREAVSIRAPDDEEEACKVTLWLSILSGPAAAGFARKIIYRSPGENGTYNFAGVTRGLLSRLVKVHTQLMLK